MRSSKIIKPYRHGNFFLAVRNEDREAYAPWLRVYAKEKTWVTLRLAALAEMYEVSAGCSCSLLIADHADG